MPAEAGVQRRATRRWVGVGVVVAVLLGLRLINLGASGHRTGGADSSSYATAPTGAAAYAELLRRAGHPIGRVTVPPREASLDPATTLVVLDPIEIVPEDAAAIRTFVESGGRLVASEAMVPWLGLLLTPPPELDTSVRHEITASSPALPGVGRVHRAGDLSWSDPGAARPAFGEEDESLVVMASLGVGEALLIADTSPLSNELLAKVDNAAFGLALAGPSARPVYFLETIHGYGSSGSGLDAIPRRWRWASVLGAAAALVWMLALGRRVGLPERVARELPPPRAAYIHALGAAVARTRDPAASIEVIRDAARRLVLHDTPRATLERGRAGAADANPPANELREIGARLGLQAPELDALFPLDATRASEDVLLHAGRALARLMERTT